MWAPDVGTWQWFRCLFGVAGLNLRSQLESWLAEVCWGCREPVPVRNALQAVCMELAQRDFVCWLDVPVCGGVIDMLAIDQSGAHLLAVNAEPFHANAAGARKVLKRIETLQTAGLGPFRQEETCRLHRVFLSTLVEEGPGANSAQEWALEFFSRNPRKRTVRGVASWGALSSVARIGRPLRVRVPVGVAADGARIVSHSLGALVRSCDA